MKILIFLVLALAVKEAPGQVLPAASSALQSMNTQTGAQATALGGAFSSIASDTTALEWNPAGMAWFTRPEIQTTYNQWFLDTFFQNLGLVYPVQWGALGIQMSYVSFGTFDNRDIFGNIQGTQTPQAFNGTVASAFRWGNLSLGLGLEGGMEIFNNYTLEGWGGEGGLLYREGTGSLSAGVRNLGEAASYGLATEYYAGASKGLGDRHMSWMFSTDLTVPEGPAVFHHGLEWGYDQVIFIRAGFQWVTQPAPLEDQAGFGCGVGVNLGSLKVDYSIVSYGDLGWTNKAGISYELGDESSGESRGKEKPAQREVPILIVEEGTPISTPTPPSAPASGKAPASQEPIEAEDSQLGMKDFYKKGIEAYQKAKYKKAVAYLKKAVSIQDPSVESFYYAEAYAMMGIMFEYHAFFNGHMDIAKGYYQQALQKEPTNATALKHLQDGS